MLVATRPGLTPYPRTVQTYAHGGAEVLDTIAAAGQYDFDAEKAGRLMEAREVVPVQRGTMAAAILEAGPSAYYPLNREAQLQDFSGNGWNGTGLNGMAAVTQNYATFDGTNDHISTTYNPFTNGTIRTFMGHAYRNTDTSTDALWGGSDAATSPFLYLDSGASALKVSFHADDALGAANWTTAWPGTLRWVHWALVFDEPNNLASLYINGALISSVAQANPYNASPGILKIGARRTASTPFDGAQANFAVFERGLSAAEIANIASRR